MKSDTAAPGAIVVGGGFSGTMAAVEMVRRGVSVALVEGHGRAGRGIAYSTREAAHLLNVPAAKMSAFADSPDHFAMAVAGEGFGAGDFVPRARFGAYLSQLLAEAVASGKVAIIERQAVAATRRHEGWEVTLDDGTALEAPALVLAHGNQPPEPMSTAAHLPPELFVNNPWLPAAGATIARLARDGGDALILGTGLTMVDLVLSLDEAGHRGRIVALSRRGLIPRPHAPFDPAPIDREEVAAGNVGRLWRWLRDRAATVGWRAAVDSLRPHSAALWQSFGPAEQRRFLRHARPWWDVHRHRIAPQVAERLKRLVAEGRLEIVAGRVASMSESDGGLDVTVTRRGSRTARDHRFAAAFNCTGPLGAIARTRDPLLRQLLADGAIVPDPLGIGLAVDNGSRAGPGLWALGPLTKGMFWEMVAVPDIRGQVAGVADDIAKELAR